MQHWTKVKEETKPGNLQHMIDDMLKRKRATAGSGQDMKDAQQEAEEKAQKRQRRIERREQKQMELEKESKESYLNKEQFEFMDKMIKRADLDLKQQ